MLQLLSNIDTQCSKSLERLYSDEHHRKQSFVARIQLENKPQALDTDLIRRGRAIYKK